MIVEEKINVPLLLSDGTKVILSHDHISDEAIKEIDLLGEISTDGIRTHVFESPFTGTESELVSKAIKIAEELRETYLAQQDKKAKKAAKRERLTATDKAGDVASPEDRDEAEADEDLPPHIEHSEYEKHLKCYLTDDEKAKAAANLVQRMEDLTRKNDALAAIKNQFKGEVARIEADISHYQSLVRDGYEFQDVSCRETRDYENENVTIVRLDTGEIVEDRRMHSSELQRTLPGMTRNETDA